MYVCVAIINARRACPSQGACLKGMLRQTCPKGVFPQGCPRSPPRLSMFPPRGPNGPEGAPAATSRHPQGGFFSQIFCLLTDPNLCINGPKRAEGPPKCSSRPRAPAVAGRHRAFCSHRGHCNSHAQGSILYFPFLGHFSGRGCGSGHFGGE